MSGEPNWCALPPFTTRGDNAQVMPCFAATLENCLDLQVLPRKLCGSPLQPLRTRVQSYHEPEMETDPTEQGPFPFLVEAAGIEPAS